MVEALDRLFGCERLLEVREVGEARVAVLGRQRHLVVAQVLDHALEVAGVIYGGERLDRLAHDICKIPRELFVRRSARQLTVEAAELERLLVVRDLVEVVRERLDLVALHPDAEDALLHRLDGIGLAAGGRA